MIEKVDVKSLNLKELEEFLLSLGEKKFRAKQIYEWMHIHHVTSFDEMTNLSKNLRETLKEKADHLGRNTYGIAMLIFHQHTFYHIPICQCK